MTGWSPVGPQALRQTVPGPCCTVSELVRSLHDKHADNAWKAAHRPYGEPARAAYETDSSPRAAVMVVKPYNFLVCNTLSSVQLRLQTRRDLCNPSILACFYVPGLAVAFESSFL